MSPKEETIRLCMNIISDRLRSAAVIADAAKVCADVGHGADAVRISLDTEQLLYEANTLLNAVSLINRVGDEQR